MKTVQWKEEYWGYEATLGCVELSVWFYNIGWRWRARCTTESGFLWQCYGTTDSKEESMEMAYKAIGEMYNMVTIQGRIR
jgi:hypothetical protein